MADNITSNYSIRELTLGASFTNNKSSQYHTIKYDFKPASVDVNKMAMVDVETNNQVTVTVPHLDGAGVPQTVFKGSQRPYTKECVLIIDRNTGEMTLEKLSSNIQVKKTRQESSVKPRPLTPVTADFTNTTQRSSSRTRVATNRRSNNPTAATGANAQSNQLRFNGNASQKPPQNMVRSPQRVKTSPPQAPWSAGGNSTLASLPMIGLDDALGAGPAAPAPAAPAPPAHSHPAHAAHGAHAAHAAHAAHPAHAAHAAHAAHNGHARPERAPYAPPEPRPHHTSHAPAAPAAQPLAQDDSSSSSSSDSDSDSNSGSDSDDNDTPGVQHPLTNGSASNPALPSDVLNDDLCLSESGSDSD